MGRRCRGRLHAYTITKAGSYKLAEPFTLSSLIITTDDVTISGNYPQNNAPTLILNAAKGDMAISTAKKNLTLQNLHITAGSDANFGTAVKLGENGVLKNSRLDLTNLNAESKTDPGRLSSVTVSAGKNVLIENTYIQAGNSATSHSRCIVIGGSAGVIITNNEFRPGKGAVWVTDQSRPITGSVAIRLIGATTDATITSNTILSTYSGAKTSMNTGIGLDSVSSATTITTTNNKFTLSSASRTDTSDNPGTGRLW